MQRFAEHRTTARGLADLLLYDAIVEGEVVPGKRYVEGEFNRVIIIPEREA